LAKPAVGTTTTLGIFIAGNHLNRGNSISSIS
jgi:hypothetical protein